MVDCKFQLLTYYEHAAGDYLLPQRHDFYELVCYVSGKGATTIGGESYGWEDTSFALIPPGVEHDEATAVKTKLYFLQFRVAKKLPALAAGFIPAGDAAASLLYGLIMRMNSEMVNKDILMREFLNCLVSEVYLVLLRRQRNTQAEMSGAEQQKQMVEKTKQYLRENFAANIDFSTLAVAFGYSYDRFRHIFKEVQGVSLIQYLLEARLYQAKNYLLNTDKNINEISVLCGFGTNVRFNNFFKEQTGMTPLKYRKVLRSQNWQDGYVNLKDVESAEEGSAPPTGDTSER